jgi:hypothetical protein
MALPKGFRNDIKLVNPKVGLERRQEMVDFLSEKNTFLPKGVHYKDIDATFIDFIKGDLKIVVDGEEVPVIFLTIQRYSEFTKTWKFTDEYKNIKLPFITIVRKPDVQVGTNYAGLYNIPGKPLYTYYKVPTNDGARTGIDLYKVPQPTSVDITYEVRLFTNKMSDLNLYNEKIQIAFNARQYYIWPNGHPMPVTLESVGDESNIDDFENRRFYVQPFEMLLAGYILDENDFEVTPSINRAMVMSEISTDPARARTAEKNVNTRGPIVAVQGNVRVVNTIGNFISTVPCNEQYVVQNSTISNSGNTYSVSLPATVNLSLPNISINSTNSGFTETIPSVQNYTIQDNVWVNSNGVTGSSEYGETIICTPVSPVNLLINGVQSEVLSAGTNFNLIALLNGISGGTYIASADTLSFTTDPFAVRSDYIEATETQYIGFGFPTTIDTDIITIKRNIRNPSTGVITTAYATDTWNNHLTATYT